MKEGNKGRIAHFFLDVDMRCGHEGLFDLVKKNKIKLVENDFIVFMNTARTIIKMFCQGKEVILHYKNDNRVLDPGIIPHLPKYCNGEKLNVDGAIKDHLSALMKRKGYE